MFLLLVLEQLSLDHFNLLPFLLNLDSLVVLLLSGHVVSLKQIHIVGVATEDALVVHDV